MAKNRPSWLLIPGDSLGQNNLIKHLYYFGWVWEPYSINEVTFSTKYDEAKIDVSLWANVGKGEHMKNSCNLLGNLFFCWCIRNPNLESGHWLATYGQ